MYEDTTVLLREIPVLRAGVGKLDQLLCDVVYLLFLAILEEWNVLFFKSIQLNQELTRELCHLREL